MIVNTQWSSASQGFTVLELVLVILIAGIIAVTVVTPSRMQLPMRLGYESQHILDDIRFTQAMSMASGQRYRWVRASSTTYQILDEGGTAVMFPNGNTTMTLASGISFGSLTNLPNNLVAFDSRGAPYTTSSYPGTALASTATIPVTNGSQTFTISITQTTGYGTVS